MYHLTNTTEVHFHLSSAVLVRGFLPVKQNLVRMRTRRTLHATTRLTSRAVLKFTITISFLFLFLLGLSCWAIGTLVHPEHSCPLDSVQTFSKSFALIGGPDRIRSHTSYTAVIPLTRFHARRCRPRLSPFSKASHIFQGHPTTIFGKISVRRTI